MSSRDILLNYFFDFIHSWAYASLQIKSSIVQDFKKLRTDVQRINFAYDMFVADTLLHKACFEEKIGKCNEKSLSLRQQGNNMFHHRRLGKALYLYTESIGYATADSPCLGAAYANRSAVLMVKGYFKECLQDIERAFQHNFPSDKKDKLESRRARAQSLLTSKKMKSIFYHEEVPVIQNKHPKISAAADCVKLEVNDRDGTHVVATRRIRAGEIISVEKPYVTIPRIKNKFLHCHHCIELSFNMIPCDACATSFYCSEKCKSEAFESYHRYECDFTSFEHAKVISFKAALLCALQKGYKDLDRESDGLYLSDRYLEISRLDTKENKMDEFDYFIYCASAAVMDQCLKMRTKFQEETGIGEDTLKEIFLRCTLVEITNTTMIERVTMGGGKWDVHAVAEGIYAFSSHYNHSCVPNCFRTYYGTTNVVRAIADIEEGQQCTVSYGWNYVYHDRSQRQASLKKNLFFSCECVACEKDWPTYKDFFTDLDFSGSVKLSAVENGFTDDWLSTQIRMLLEHVAILQMKRIMSRAERDDLLSQCFNLQKMVNQPSKALACVQNIILHILLIPGNVATF